MSPPPRIHGGLYDLYGFIWRIKSRTTLYALIPLNFSPLRFSLLEQVTKVEGERMHISVTLGTSQKFMILGPER